MLTVRLFVCAVAILLTSASARGQECLSQYDAVAGRVGRDAAVEYIAAVNTAQMERHKQGQRYRPLNELPNAPAAPVGFVPKLLFDRWSYIVVLKDYFNACGCAVVSDERGVIYEAHLVTPIGPEPDGSSESPE